MCIFGCSLNDKNWDSYYDHIAIVLTLCAQFRTLLSIFFMNQYFFLIPTRKSFFTIQLVCIIFGQTLHTFEKYSIKVCIFRFSTAQVKIPQILSFFQQKVSFSSKFSSLFSVMSDNYSVLFHLKLYNALEKRNPSQCKLSKFNCSHQN